MRVAIASFSGMPPSSPTTGGSSRRSPRAGSRPRCSPGTIRTPTGASPGSSSSARPGTTPGAARSSCAGASRSATAFTTASSWCAGTPTSATSASSPSRHPGGRDHLRRARRAAAGARRRGGGEAERLGRGPRLGPLRARAHDLARELIEAIQASGRTAMIQPYQPSVDTAGETAVLCIDGEPAHALRKRAVLRPDEVAPIRDDGVGAAEVMYDPGLVTPAEADDDELELARAVVAELRRRFDYLPLYARVDMIRGAPAARPCCSSSRRSSRTSTSTRCRRRPPLVVDAIVAGWAEPGVSRPRSPASTAARPSLGRRRVGVGGRRARPRRRELAAGGPRQRAGDRLRVVGAHRLAADRLDDPARLGPGGEREDRPLRRQVLEQLDVEQLRAGRLRDQQQGVGLALQRQRRSAGRGCRRGRSGPGRRRSRTAPPPRRSAARRSPARASPPRPGRERASSPSAATSGRGSRP